MTIVVLVEGDTEVALMEHVRNFLNSQAANVKKTNPKIKSLKIDGANPVTIGKQIRNSLHMFDVVAVVGLIDVYPKFANASDAKKWLFESAKSANITQGFYAHAAQYDVEAWLLPYWDSICQRIGVKQSIPSPYPENINGDNPPAYRLKALYQRAKPARTYIKTKEMPAILRNKDLLTSISACPEFKAFINTLLSLNQLPTIS